MENNTLERIEDLLKHILAVQLYNAGASQQQVANHLRISVGKCNELLKGVHRGIEQNENSGSQNSR